MQKNTSSPQQETLNNSPAPENQKEFDFTPGDVSDIYDKLILHNHALRAFGTLLESANFECFAEPELESGKYDLRYGLKLIIELCLEHQEQILNEHLKAYQQSDSILINKAGNVLKDLAKGHYAHNSSLAIAHLRERIPGLNIVIARGGDFADLAKDMKQTCENWINNLKKSKGVAGA